MADLPPLLQAALQLRAETSISRLFLPAMDDNNRPPLSPAAQAVLNAYKEASDGHYINGEWFQDHAGQIAAALRAVADQVEHSWDGAECVDHLQVIAAELEAHDG